MLWLVLPTSCVALFLGCRKHKRLSIAVTGIVGMAILVSVAFYGHEWFGVSGEKNCHLSRRAYSGGFRTT